MWDKGGDFGFEGTAADLFLKFPFSYWNFSFAQWMPLALLSTRVLPTASLQIERCVSERLRAAPLRQKLPVSWFKTSACKQSFFFCWRALEIDSLLA